MMLAETLYKSLFSVKDSGGSENEPVVIYFHSLEEAFGLMLYDQLRERDNLKKGRAGEEEKHFYACLNLTYRV